MFNCIPAYCEGAYWSDEAARLERSRLCGTPGYDWEPCTRVLSVAERVAQGTFGGCNWSAAGTFPKGAVPKFTVERGCFWECPPGTTFQNYITGPVCFRDFRDEFNAGEFAVNVAKAAAATAAVVAPAILAPGALAAAGTFASQYTTALQAGGALNMSLDLGGIIGGSTNILSSVLSGNYLGALQGVGSLATSFLPQPAAMPAMYPVPSLPPPAPVYSAPAVAQPVGAFAVPAAAAGALMARVAPILQKIAVKIGLRARPSLTRAMELVRKAAKLLQSPEAVAVALGITTAELATLITTHNARRRRRMNPANSKALRRAARRIKSFHKLCTHTDVLRGRARRSSAARCGTCRKSPCRC